MKEYYETNKEKINEKNKEYQETNKTTILEKKRKKIKCECGCEVTKNDLKRHQTSKKDISLMKCI
jgi:hypothetical protein